MLNAGLEVELEHRAESFDRRTYFLKVHAPDEILERNAEIIGMKPPVKEYIVTYYSSKMHKINLNSSGASWWLKDQIVKSIFNCDTIPPEPNIFTPGFIPDILDK